MTWNYRLVKHILKEGIYKDKNMAIYDVCEVYYDSVGNPEAVSIDPITFGCDEEVEFASDEEAKKEVIAALQNAIKDIQKYDIFEEPDSWNEDNHADVD